MSSYVASNLSSLSRRHYLRRAGTEKYWFDFMHGKMESYRKKYGDDFCLVIYRPGDRDDAYIFPYSRVKHLFRDEYLDNRNRWVGVINKKGLSVRGSEEPLSVSKYFNAFEMLDASYQEPRQTKPVKSYQFAAVGNPLFSSPLHNPVLFRWFVDSVQNRMKEVTADENIYMLPEHQWAPGLDIFVTEIGFSPLSRDEFHEFFCDYPFCDELVGADQVRSDWPVIVLGRTGWNSEIIDRHIQARKGHAYFYSQEMVMAYVITGVDPYLEPQEEVLRAFAAGHPGLEYLQQYQSSYFRWPHVHVSGGLTSQEGPNLGDEGILYALGYTVGIQGSSTTERRRILAKAYSIPPLEFPRISNQDSLKKWSESAPQSARRLQLIAHYIAGMCRRRRARKDSFRYRRAIRDYESDLKWLREQFYELYSFTFQWPGTHLRSKTEA
jgi:hypothetical protein